MADDTTQEESNGVGRPSDYDDKYVQEVEDYLLECVDKYNEDLKGIEVKIPTREGFALKIGKNRGTLTNWGERVPEFLSALERIDMKQKERLFSQGLAGRYNATIAKLGLASNHGMADKTETKVESKSLAEIVEAAKALNNPEE